MTIKTNDHLPLRLIQSETLPPSHTVSPTIRSTNADFLPDFAGYAWVAYAASSLLVISHFPSPLSPHHPISRQVIPLSPTYAVSAVAWSDAVPSSGDLAAVVDRRVFLFVMILLLVGPGNTRFHDSGNFKENNGESKISEMNFP
ncbi:hypothetical protein KSS87_015129 [Heliosperma pusillum]|nr:hypothetical protein KSS87_015129 [Heliosperma pusillum]